MAGFDWEEKNWDDLIYAIHQKKCILMLGPGAATEEAEGQPRLLTEILANQMAEHISPEEKTKINPSNLAQVSQCYMKNNRYRLECKVCDFYEERRKLTNNLHKNLADVDFYFTVSTTPDYLFYRALKNKGKIPVRNWYNFRGGIPGNVSMGTPESPLLYYLYGSVAKPESLLITENDLLDFLVALISRKPPLPDNIRSELQDQHKSFLFLGFGFEQWYLRILLHVLQGGRKKNSPSFALEKFTQESAARLEPTVFFFQSSGYNIEIYNNELNLFVEELKKRYLDFKKKYKARKTDSTQPQFIRRLKVPKVFICHASENKEKAKSLYREFEAAGFKVWLDKENLRGGDNWDETIKKVIEKEIDYLVVLQSHELAKKIETYAHKEILMALDRQQKFKPGIRFVIPVKIDDSPIEEELAHLHAIDLTDEANTVELIKTIKRDFIKRGNR